MKVAVTLFGVRVSPRFDGAPQVLIVDTAQDGERARQIVDLSVRSALQRVQTLREWQVDVVICGAIDQASCHLLCQADIELYSWVTGTAEEALQLFREGRLRSGVILRGRGKQPQRWRFRAGWGYRFDNG